MGLVSEQAPARASPVPGRVQVSALERVPEQERVWALGPGQEWARASVSGRALAPASEWAPLRAPQSLQPAAAALNPGRT
jgi:hypothetical protein